MEEINVLTKTDNNKSYNIILDNSYVNLANKLKELYPLDEKSVISILLAEVSVILFWRPKEYVVESKVGITKDVTKAISKADIIAFETM